jgi:excinuclease ABC subunit B
MASYRFKLPNDYKGVVYQIIRPTGLLDPVIDLRPSLPETFLSLIQSIQKQGLTDLPILLESYWKKPQVLDLIEEIKKRVEKNQRVLVTTLTKRMAEELSDYFSQNSIKSKYLHSEIDTVERVELLTQLRRGEYDVLVGINLLREGLDLPEVSLIAILDADKEGFLRSKTSLIQIIGRAARHQDGTVIMYADKVTDSMREAILETQRRRNIQQEYNAKNNIIPTSVQKDINSMLENYNKTNSTSIEPDPNSSLQKQAEIFKTLKKTDQRKLLKEIEMQMQIYADMLEFEKAKEMRDLLFSLK